jgi:hypothetical protein
MDPRQKLARLAQLKAEGDMIMQELIASGMPPEQIMAAVEGGGQPGGPPPGLGADRGPGLPPGIPANGGGGMPPSGAVPQGLLGPG